MTTDTGQEMSVETNEIPASAYLMPSIAHATVADAMHPGIVSCDPYASLAEVATLMATHRVHCLVLMGVGDAYAWGVISDLDVLEAGIRDRDDRPTAMMIAGNPAISVEPTMSLRRAGELMATNQVSHVVVVDPMTLRPVGILSTLDIAGVLAWGGA